MTKRRLRHGPRRQGGNALILALLALAIAGITAATALQSRRLEIKREAGLAEFTVLDRLRNALNATMHEHLTQVQLGQPIVKAGESVAPEQVEGALVWRPTIAQLRSMGYLPEGWSVNSSSLNGAAYAITLQRSPTGCVAAACDIEGRIVVMGPVLDVGKGTVTDGVLIGPILTRAGADGGVSLATSPGVITGFGGTWTMPNPVPGAPAGVIAMRVGTNTGGFSQFVRIGDVRDPTLGGNLTAAGNLSVGGNATVQGTTQLNGSLVASDLDGNPCVNLDRSGVVTVACAGTLNAATGNFTGKVSGNGFSTAANSLFDVSDPNAIYVNGGEMFIRGPSGTLVSFTGGNVIASGAVGGTSLALRTAVVEGDGCISSSTTATEFEYGATSQGGLAACVEGRWAPLVRFSARGANCLAEGASATDVAGGGALICRRGQYLAMASLLSDFVLVDTIAIRITTAAAYVPKPDCGTGGVENSEALIILTPNNEDAAMVGGPALSGINRFAVDRGEGWEVVLEKSADQTPLAGNLIASLYCFYG